MLNIFKTKRINVPEGQKTIVAAQSWVVRWKSSNSHWGLYQEQAEFFTEEQDAYDFADALKKAFKLTRTWNGDISVKENV